MDLQQEISVYSDCTECEDTCCCQKTASNCLNYNEAQCNYWGNKANGGGYQGYKWQCKQGKLTNLDNTPTANIESNWLTQFCLKPPKTGISGYFGTFCGQYALKGVEGMIAEMTALGLKSYQSKHPAPEPAPNSEPNSEPNSAPNSEPATNSASEPAPDIAPVVETPAELGQRLAWKNLVDNELIPKYITNLKLRNAGKPYNEPVYDKTREMLQDYFIESPGESLSQKLTFYMKRNHFKKKKVQESDKPCKRRRLQEGSVCGDNTGDGTDGNGYDDEDKIIQDATADLKPIAKDVTDDVKQITDVLDFVTQSVKDVPKKIESGVEWGADDLDNEWKAFEAKHDFSQHSDVDDIWETFRSVFTAADAGGDADAA